MHCDWCMSFQHVILLFLTKKKLKVRNSWEGDTVISVFSMSHGRFHELSENCRNTFITCMPSKVSSSANSGPNGMKPISARFCHVKSSCFNKKYGDDPYNVDFYRFVSHVMDIQWVTGSTESIGSHSKEQL